MFKRKNTNCKRLWILSDSNAPRLSFCIIKNAEFVIVRPIQDNSEDFLYESNTLKFFQVFQDSRSKFR